MRESCLSSGYDMNATFALVDSEVTVTPHMRESRLSSGYDMNATFALVAHRT